MMISSTFLSHVLIFWLELVWPSVFFFIISMLSYYEVFFFFFFGNINKGACFVKTSFIPLIVLKVGQAWFKCKKYILIISFGELQVSIGNIYLGIYVKCFPGVAEQPQIKRNQENPTCFFRNWTPWCLFIFSFNYFQCAFPSLRK